MREDLKILVAADVESTLLQEESLDVIAERQGMADAVKKLCVMGSGTLWTPESQVESLFRRANLLGLTSEMAREQSLLMTPTEGVMDLIRWLIDRDLSLFAISGGLRQIILPKVVEIGVLESDVFAPTALFHPEKTGIQSMENPHFTWKKWVITELKKKIGATLAIMIGDGSNDVQAGDINIAFTGIEARPRAIELAHFQAQSFSEVQAILAEVMNLRGESPWLSAIDILERLRAGSPNRQAA